MDQSGALTPADIRRAVVEGIIDTPTAERLLQWSSRRPLKSRAATETRTGLNFVSVAYYIGALLMISACAWFLGDKWESLGDAGVLVTCLIYAGVAAGIGVWLRANEYSTAGGLLVTVAVSLTPLVTYSIEHMTGMWPLDSPGSYARYYPWIHGSWVAMELATIAAGAIALRYVRFGFLLAPVAFSFWFLSMDLFALLMGYGELTWSGRAWVSVFVGAITIGLGYGLERTIGREEAVSEDFAFWCYLFGLMAFWGGLTAMNSDSEAGKFLYLLTNVGLIGLAVWLRRATFVVFGAMGCWAYVGHLAYTVFKDSALFPFAIAGIGLVMILTTVWAQRQWRAVLAQ
jgi:hypothetical protein